jgi:carnitine O-acetyltransferase
MLRHQDELERLPVPSLAETCDLYLQLVRPLLADAEFEATRRTVADFARTDGPGEALQRRLLHFSEGKASWLEPFWDDWYLCDDTPLPVNVSPGFVLSGQGRPQVARAAGLLAAALRFKRLVDTEQLEPDRENGAPRCMREYSRILSSTRIPGVSRDRLERFPDSRHVVVARGGRLYSLHVSDEAGRPYAVRELERALEWIAHDTAPAAVPVGVLTTDRRRDWAHVRDELLRRGPPAARATLGAVESAILLLALDTDSSPREACSTEAARMVLHGTGSQRWFDKSIQLVVAPSGVAGFCMEHSGFDGASALRFARFLAAHESSAVGETTSPHHELVAERLRIEPGQPLSVAIRRSEERADALAQRTDLAIVYFGDFGRDAIVRHRLSPDAFVQMAFQLAHYAFAGGTASTYEAVDTKHFLHGRTEAMRSVSSESVALVHALRGGRASSNAPRLLSAAVARHAAVVRRCREGRGVDRHLLGLRRMLEPDEPVPALFDDPGYATLSRSVLSTSSLPSARGVEFVCFGPVVDEGFGISYTIHDESIRCVVTNFHGDAARLAEAIESGLRELYALLGHPG